MKGVVEGQVRTALANLGRRLRELIDADEGGPVFEKSGTDYRAAFVTRDLAFDGQVIRFGR